MGDVIRVLFGKHVAERLYAEACRIDDEPSRQREAEQMYLRAMALHPTSETAVNLGHCHYKQGSVTEARQCFERALKLEAGNAVAHYNLGVLEVEEGNHSIAIGHLQRAVSCKSQMVDAWLYLATEFETLGMRKEARQAWEQFLTLEPEDSTRALVAKRRLGGMP